MKLNVYIGQATMIDALIDFVNVNAKIFTKHNNKNEQK